MKKVILFLLIGAFAAGCRTVWIHPEATAQKYADDVFWCQYGYHRDERIAEHTAPKPLHRGWRQCMEALGWETTTSVRAASRYRVGNTDSARTMREETPQERQTLTEYETATWVGDSPKPQAAMYQRDAALCRGESWDPDEIAQLGQLGRDTGLVLSTSTRAKYAACMAGKNWVYVE